MTLFTYCFPLVLLAPVFIVRSSFVLFALIGSIVVVFQTCLFSSSGQQIVLDSFLCLDELSFWIVYISVFVVAVSAVVFKVFTKTYSLIPLGFMLIICVFFFASSNFIEIYILYEISLVPIVFVILKWGNYSERSKSALYMIVYTMVFTLPLLLVLLYFYCNSSYLLCGVSHPVLPSWVIFYVLLGFLVKLPLFGLHFWLPQAHVEAPTVGSMILAGLLLKLGGYGLFRVIFVVPFSSDTGVLAGSYTVVSLVVVSLVTCFQTDFKRLVAYSSVVHISALFMVVVQTNALTFKVYLIIILFHGILSPLLFFYVNLVYSLFKTRLLALVGSIKSVSLILYLFLVFGFLISIPTPPFPQFYFEVLMFISILSFSNLIYLVLVVFTFLSLVYNLIWFVSTTLTGHNISMPFSPSLFELLVPVVFVVFILFVFSLLAVL